MKKSLIAVALIAAFTVSAASSVVAWESKSMEKGMMKSYKHEMPMKRSYTPKTNYYVDPCYYLPGNTASATQFGYQNTARINQKGCANQAHVVQDGAYNRGSIDQRGYGNQGQILQGGAFNTGTIQQHGYNNQGQILQGGFGDSAAIRQSGSGNSASISQN